MYMRVNIYIYICTKTDYSGKDNDDNNDNNDNKKKWSHMMIIVILVTLIIVPISNMVKKKTWNNQPVLGNILQWSNLYFSQSTDTGFFDAFICVYNHYVCIYTYICVTQMYIHILYAARIIWLSWKWCQIAKQSKQSVSSHCYNA